jgi:hypothetical protein
MKLAFFIVILGILSGVQNIREKGQGKITNDINEDDKIVLRNRRQ